MAQAELRLVKAQGQQDSSYQALLAAMGVNAMLKINIDGSTRRALPSTFDGVTQKMLESAFSRRPDVIASYAALQASKAGIKAAQAEFLPKVLCRLRCRQVRTALMPEACRRSAISHRGRAFWLARPCRFMTAACGQRSSNRRNPRKMLRVKPSARSSSMRLPKSSGLQCSEDGACRQQGGAGAGFDLGHSL